MKALAKAAIASLVIITATGCAAMHVYDGPPRSREQVSVITGVDTYGYIVAFTKVDGKGIKRFSQAPTEIVVLPGKHEIETLCWMRGGRASTDVISIDTQAGVDYQAIIVVLNRKCSTMINIMQK